MDRKKKQVVVQGIQAQLAGKQLYVVDHQSLKVVHTNALRRQGEQQGVTCQVAKNTLLRRAVEKCYGQDSHASFCDKVLAGPTTFLVAEDPSAPAKLVQNFRKQYSTFQLRLKGAIVHGGSYLGDDQLGTLSKIKSKTALLGDLVSTLQSPPVNVVTALQSGHNKLAGMLKTLSQR